MFVSGDNELNPICYSWSTMKIVQLDKKDVFKIRPLWEELNRAVIKWLPTNKVLGLYSELLFEITIE